MNETLQEIIKEIENIQIWGFEDCPQRFQVTNAIKQRAIKIVRKHIQKGEKKDDKR